MATGISLRPSSYFSSADVVCPATFLTVARLDPRGVRADAHCIAFYRARTSASPRTTASAIHRCILVLHPLLRHRPPGDTSVGAIEAVILLARHRLAEDTFSGVLPPRISVLGNVSRNNVSDRYAVGANTAGRHRPVARRLLDCVPQRGPQQQRRLHLHLLLPRHYRLQRLLQQLYLLLRRPTNRLKFPRTCSVETSTVSLAPLWYCGLDSASSAALLEQTVICAMVAHRRGRPPYVRTNRASLCSPP